MPRAPDFPALAEARKREWHLKCTPAGGKEKTVLAAATPSALDRGA